MSAPPQVNNWPKFVLLLTGMVGMLAAWMIGVATWDQIELPLTGILFYAAGIATAKQQPQQPIFAPRRRADDA